MTQDTRSLAEAAILELSAIGGVFACAVRAHASSEKLYEKLETDGLSPSIVAEQVEKAAREFTERAPAPFPHVVQAKAELAHYLCGLTDLLAPGHDDRLDARIGPVRMVAESWGHLIVAVAIASSDPGVKSLVRGLRRARRRVEGRRGGGS